VVGLLLYGLSLVLAGLAPFYPMFLAVLVSVGLTRVLFMTAGETMMQFSSNLGVRGRVMAFWTMVIVGGQAIGGPLMGWIAEQIGPKNAMVVSGAVPAVAAVVIAILLGRDRLRSSWSRRRVRSEPGKLRLRRRPLSASSVPQSDS
jgi:MFS family permease